LGVDGGGFEFYVAEHNLQKPDVGSVFEHRRGTGVPEQVARSTLAEVGGGGGDFVRGRTCSIPLTTQ
jgi:hypothetical protein